MSEMLHPDSGTAAPGADVLAAIRRLLAEDAREDDGAPRHGALRRRLIGTRRPAPPAPVCHEAPEPEAMAASGDPWLWTAPQPLRLADAQRVAPALSDVEAEAGPDGAEAGLKPAPAETLPQGPEPDMSPAEAASEPADTWPFAAGHPAARLRELLTFQAWIAEDAAPDSAPDTATAAPVAPASVAAPGAEAAPLPAPAAMPAVLAGAPAAEAVPLLRTVIRDTLLEELAGETGAHLSAAINALTRRAVAGALADLAREMGALHSADGTDLH